VVATLTDGWTLRKEISSFRDYATASKIEHVSSCPPSPSCCVLRALHVVLFYFIFLKWHSRSQWPRDLRRRSAAARLLRMWVRIPPGVWMSVCCWCCVLSGRGLCDGLIPRPAESYRLWCVVVCDLLLSCLLCCFLNRMIIPVSISYGNLKHAQQLTDVRHRRKHQTRIAYTKRTH